MLASLSLSSFQHPWLRLSRGALLFLIFCFPIALYFIFVVFGVQCIFEQCTDANISEDMFVISNFNYAGSQEDIVRTLNPIEESKQGNFPQ